MALNSSGVKRRIFHDPSTPLGEFLVQFFPETGSMELAWRRSFGDTWGPPLQLRSSDDD